MKLDHINIERKFLSNSNWKILKILFEKDSGNSLFGAKTINQIPVIINKEKFTMNLHCHFLCFSCYYWRKFLVKSKTPKVRLINK